MGLTAGIVGLPNVGKSTLFNAITKQNILAANYPFATIDPNVGMVIVPDDRIDKLLKAAQYSIPCKMELSSLIGAYPPKERGMNYLEKVLGLGTTSWNQPLVSSNIQSGTSDNGDGSEGRTSIENPEDLTDEGENTRDKK